MKMMPERKVAVVTGGAHGIGKAIADGFVREGTIVITLNTEGLESENDLTRCLSLLLNREMPLKERQENRR